MADSHPLISIVVPVYNVEPFLREALDSVCAQTYTNLQIILVDDGSPDNCGKICDEYAARDSRISVIHQPNAGVACARQCGLQAVKGVYLTFIDPDDVADPDYIQTLYDARLRHPNSFICSPLRMTSLPDAAALPDQTFAQGIHFFLAQTKYSTIGKLYLTRYAQNYMFKSYCIGEDMCFNLDYLCDHPEMTFIPSAKYYYRTHSQSILHRHFSPKQLDALDAYDYLYHKVQEQFPHEAGLARMQYVVSIFTTLERMLQAHHDYCAEQRFMRHFMIFRSRQHSLFYWGAWPSYWHAALTYMQFFILRYWPRKHMRGGASFIHVIQFFIQLLRKIKRG